MKKSTAFMKKLTALLVLALTVTLPPATPPNPETEEYGNTEDNENGKENTNLGKEPENSPCSDQDRLPPPKLN